MPAAKAPKADLENQKPLNLVKRLVSAAIP